MRRAASTRARGSEAGEPLPQRSFHFLQPVGALQDFARLAVVGGPIMPSRCTAPTLSPRPRREMLSLVWVVPASMGDQCDHPHPPVAIPLAFRRFLSSASNSGDRRESSVPPGASGTRSHKSFSSFPSGCCSEADGTSARRLETSSHETGGNRSRVAHRGPDGPATAGCPIPLRPVR